MPPCQASPAEAFSIVAGYLLCRIFRYKISILCASVCYLVTETDDARVILKAWSWTVLWATADWSRTANAGTYAAGDAKSALARS